MAIEKRITPTVRVAVLKTNKLEAKEVSFPSSNLNEILSVEENARIGIKLVNWT